MSRLERLRARHSNVIKETGAELAKSKERLARERMAHAEGLNWYSQRFNESGRQFFIDTSDAGVEGSKNNTSQPVTNKLPLDKLRERHSHVIQETGAELARSKERLARKRMAQSQGLNWYSKRFNESGGTFYMDTSDGGVEASGGKIKSKPVKKKLSLEKLERPHNNIEKETPAKPVTSSERQARERMAQSQGLHWYSQRFNESGRRFYMDTSNTGGEASESNNRKNGAKQLSPASRTEQNENAKNETGAGPATSKERQVRERMAQAQGLNWYSSRFNESGRRFYMDQSDAGEKSSDSTNRKSITKKVPPLKEEPAAEPAKSKERLVRERMAQAQGLNWYSSRFNESGRRFYMDPSDTGGEASKSSNDSKPVAKTVPLHVQLKQENEKLRRKLEKTESERKLLKKRVSTVAVPIISTERAILKTKLREAKAQFTTLELELSETKNELSQKEASTFELMEKMKQMKEAYDNLARQMKSRGGTSSIGSIPEDGDFEELKAEVNELKHENRRLHLEKELSMRQSFGRLGSISELNPHEGTKLSITSLSLTDAEMRVVETAGELQDTQVALTHAQSLIQKLKREKEVLAQKMESRLQSHRSHLDASRKSEMDAARNQQSTLPELSPTRGKTRGLSMVGKQLVGNDLSDADSSLSSLLEEDWTGDPHTPKAPAKWRRKSLDKDLLTLKGDDLNILNQASIFSTSLLLICGFPLLALAFSVGSIVIYAFQKDHTLPYHSDVQKYFLINCSGVVMSFGSWSLRAQAMEDPSRTFRFIIAALVREFAGLVLAWFIYTDYKGQDYEPEVLDFIEVKVKIFAGRNLVAKDKNIFGKAKSSDPYVQIFHAKNFIGKTRIAWKTLNPTWNTASFTILAVPSQLEAYGEVVCKIYDHDTLSADDSMGTVTVPIPGAFNEKVRKWYPVTNGSGDDYCRNATGHLDVEVVVLSRASSQAKIKTASKDTAGAEASPKVNGESDSKVEHVGKEGVQSLGEITAETKAQAASRDAVVVKI